MPGLAAPDFANAMKTYYLGPLNQQVAKATVLLDRLQKNSEYVSGNFSYIPLISGRNPGVGSRQDASGSGPTLPDSGRQGYNKATFPMTYHYGRGQVSGPVMRASKNQQGAFAQALDVEMQGLMESLPEDLNRQLWSYGHGRTGTLAVNGGSTSTTFSLSSASFFNAKIGDRVHFATIAAGASPAPSVGTTITAITRDSTSTLHVITLAAAPGRAVTAGTDTLYYGSKAAGITVDIDTSRANEMYGIPAAISGENNLANEEAIPVAGTVPVADEFVNGALQFGAIDRTTNAFWKSQWLQNPVAAGTNRPLTNAVMQHAYLSAVNIGGANPKNIEVYTNPGIWMTLGLLHIGDRRYSDYQETLEAGWVFLKYNGIKVFYDRDAIRDVMFWIDMTTLLLLSQSEYELMDEDGKVLNRVVDRDAYEFTLYKDIQLGAKNCAKNVRLDDIQSAANIEATV